jgi:hypothetical protein
MFSAKANAAFDRARQEHKVLGCFRIFSFFCYFFFRTSLAMRGKHVISMCPTAFSTFLKDSCSPSENQMKN